MKSPLRRCLMLTVMIAMGGLFAGGAAVTEGVAGPATNRKNEQDLCE